MDSKKGCAACVVSIFPKSEIVHATYLPFGRRITFRFLEMWTGSPIDT